MTEKVQTLLKRALDLQVAGKLAAAETLHREILKHHPDQVDALHLLGLIHAESDQNDEAIALIERAISLKNDAPAFHHNLAGIYRRVGRIEDATTAFRRAIELKPNYGEAYQGLAEMVKFQSGDDFIQAVEAQIAGGKLDKAQLSYLHFAAGKFFDDTGQYQKAFDHYQLGNRLAGRKFSRDGYKQQIKSLLYVFSPQLVQQLKTTGFHDAEPVFVVGMPRSGTSLAEQILSSHSQVFGAGELNEMKLTSYEASKQAGNSVYPDCLVNLPKSSFERLGQFYTGAVAKRVGQVAEPRIVDKHPLNFLYVGLILAILPKAKIVHTIRHPLDTCLSCFFQNFTRGQDYSFDLADLAVFYNGYHRLMQHWQSLYGDRIFDLEYEQLLSDQEGETRRLLSFCELPFEAACLGFHDTDRAVKTASFLQVRQPLYQSSRQRWRKYAPQLKEFAGWIGQPVDEPVTISALRGLR